MALDWIEWPIVVKMNPNALSVNGIEIPYMVVAQILNELTHPDPRKWIRMERVGDCVHISTRISEDEPNGTRIRTFSNGEAHDGGEGQAAAHPSNAHPPNGE